MFGRERMLFAAALFALLDVSGYDQGGEELGQSGQRGHRDAGRRQPHAPTRRRIGYNVNAPFSLPIPIAISWALQS